jgi:hypothetical protein
MIQTRIETQDFVHPQLGREVTAIGAYYVFGKEICLPYKCFISKMDPIQDLDMQKDVRRLI